VKAVRSDDDPGVLGHGLAILAVAANADDTSVLGDDILDGKRLSNLRSCLGRGVQEQLVEHGAPRGVSDGRVVRPRGAGDPDGTYVSIGGHPVATSRSSKPHLSRAATPGGWMRCVEIVSLGNLVGYACGGCALLSIGSGDRDVLETRPGPRACPICSAGSEVPNRTADGAGSQFRRSAARNR
jgi:hypothetical protein